MRKGIRRTVIAAAVLAALLSVFGFFAQGTSEPADKTEEIVNYVVDNARKGVTTINTSQFRFAFSESLKNTVIPTILSIPTAPTS